jgi:aspartate ammonia-lyase
MSANLTRIEHDLLGERQVPADALWGIHTLRAVENFPLAKQPVHPSLIAAYGAVKLACCRTNRELGAWPDRAKADALGRACEEMMAGRLDAHMLVDALQGGAGTSTNMNVNEVLANRGLQIMGRAPGAYDIISPLDDVNLHQSTNDTYPTALRLAAIWRLKALEQAIVSLQETLQRKEKEFSHIVKVGRTEMQDAVLITLGREVGAWAEAIGRDRWRIYKCEERLRVVNLGGTAVGTGLGAPRAYIFRVVDALREITGIGLARAENLIDATQNADVFVEVSGILKACAVSLAKISADLRFLSSSPLAELNLPPLQAGSSIMPGKVNPVIPEAVSQAAMLVFGFDQTIAHAAASGSLELNPFLPLVAHCLLQSIDLLTNAAGMLDGMCIDAMTADESRCRDTLLNTTATATALVPLIGYQNVAAIVAASRSQGITIRAAALASGLIDGPAFDAAITPEAVCRLGQPSLQTSGDRDAARA